MSSDFYNIFLHDQSGNTVEVISDTLTADRVIKLPNSSDTLATLGDIGAAGGGSVTSVGLVLPDIFGVSGSPVTTSGVITGSLVSQTANTFLGVGNTNGVPTFKTLTTTDVPDLPFTKITGVAITAQLPSIPTTKLTGILQDSQMANGTNNSYFQIDSDNNGARIAWDSGASEITLRTSDDSAYADLRINNLFVEGDSTIIESETLSVADNKILLNSDITGSPTEDSGLEVERGTAANAFLQWNETADIFEAGIAGSLLRLIRQTSGTIQAGDIAGNVVTITHNLSNPHPDITIVRTDGVEIEFSLTRVDDNSMSFDSTRSGSPVGWAWFAKG